MSIFLCRSLEYIFLHQCELDENENIVPISENEFLEIYSKDNIEFSEKSRNKKGNISYNQKLKVKYKYEYVSEIQALSNSHLILRLTKLDGSTFVWGSIEDDYNPVQVKINIKSNIAELNFYRESLKPEY